MTEFKWQLIFLAFLFFNQRNIEARTDCKRNQDHAFPKQFPYQVYIDIFKDYNLKKIPSCAGVIISNRRILTTARCIPKNLDFITIYLGAVDIKNEMEMGKQLLYVREKNIVVHPEWDPDQNINNIALIKLPADLQFDEYVQPIQLPDPDKSYDYDIGVFSAYGSSNDQLMYSNVTILSNEECKTIELKNNPGGFFPSSWICLKSIGCGKCSGDSGGPLAIRHEDGNSILLGLKSAVSDDSCSVNEPRFLTRISSYLQWINEN
ncbi:collagenase-like [Drosophila innubila]|uniref:collagenase-like n=1 Tax=Drosophila innubila TaxID=198719 RepID=UPI00148BAC36|nr:collagenase-like [Drosophila innubila]